MTTTLDDVVVAGNADIREMAFKNLEMVVSGWGKVAGMLDDRHPLAQAVIGMNMMAERSLRAIALTPAHVMASETGGAAIMKAPAADVDADVAEDTRKPWAVAHASRKNYCIGRKEGCPYSVHGNSIHKHMKDCEIAKAIRVREARALLADTADTEAKVLLANAAKNGVTDDGTAGKVMKLPTSKSDKRSMTKYCSGRDAGCDFSTKSGRWIARHQAECTHAKSVTTTTSEKPVEKSVEKTKRATKYCSGRDAGCGFSTKSDRWIARHQNVCGIAKKAQGGTEKGETAKRGKRAGKTRRAKRKTG